MDAQTASRRAPAAAAGSAQPARAWLRCATSLMRYTPVGLVGVSLMLALAVAVAVMVMRSGSETLMFPTILAPVLVAAMAQGLMAALVGSGVVMLERRLHALRVPAGTTRLRQVAGAWWCLLWLLPALLWAGLPSHGHGLWIWPLSAAIGAGAIALGAGLTVGTVRTAWGWLAMVCFIIGIDRASWLGTWMARLPGAGLAVHVAVALGSLAAVALAAAAVRRWMPLAVRRPTLLPSEAMGREPVTPSGGHRGSRPMLDALVMPGPDRIRKVDLANALLIAAIYGAVFQVFMPSPSLALAVALAWTAALDGAVYARGGDLSARALWLPGGLHRASLMRQVCAMAWRRSWRRTAALSLPSLLVLAFATDLGATHVAALIPALAGALIWGCTLAAATLGAVPGWRQLLLAAAPGAWLLVNAQWMPWAPDASATAQASSWLTWSLVTGLLTVLLSAVTLLLGAPRVKRLDARCLGPLADRAGMES